MRLRYVWLFCIVNFAACGVYFFKHWNAQKELYWAIIALLNTKIALLLMLTQVVSLYTAIVMSVHQFIFTRTKEGERFVLFLDFRK